MLGPECEQCHALEEKVFLPGRNRLHLSVFCPSGDPEFDNNKKGSYCTGIGSAHENMAIPGNANKAL